MPSRLILATVAGALLATTAAAAALLDQTVLAPAGGQPAVAAQAPEARPLPGPDPVIHDDPDPDPEFDVDLDLDPEVNVDLDLEDLLLPGIDLEGVLADVEDALRQSVEALDVEDEIEDALESVDLDAVVAQAMRRVDEALAGSPRLGVAIRDLTAEEAKAAGLEGIAGAWVTDVTADSPAGKAGLATGDVLVRVDGQDVRGARHLSRVIGETPTGGALRLEYLRSGQRQTVTVTPERTSLRDRASRDALTAPRAFRFEGAPRLAPLMPMAERGRLGVGVMDLTPQLATYFGVERGVLVTTVRDASAAARGGLKAGDVITRVGTTAVARVGDLSRALRDVERGTSVSIEVSRERKAMTIDVTPDTAPTRQRVIVRQRHRMAAN